MADPEEGVNIGQLLLAVYQSVKDEQGRVSGSAATFFTRRSRSPRRSPRSRRSPIRHRCWPPCRRCASSWGGRTWSTTRRSPRSDVRNELGPRLSQLAGSSGDFAAFGWQRAHRSDARRRSRKAFQCVVDLAVFYVLPLVVFWAGGPGGGLLVALSVLEALAVAGLAVQVVLYARPARGAA